MSIQQEIAYEKIMQKIDLKNRMKLVKREELKTQN